MFNWSAVGEFLLASLGFTAVVLYMFYMIDLVTDPRARTKSWIVTGVFHVILFIVMCVFIGFNVK